MNRILCLLALAAAAMPASGSYSYVDATLENTTLAGAPLTLEAPANYVEGSSSGADGLWSFRSTAGFEGGGSYFECDSGAPPLAGGLNDHETTPDLITTLSLPTAGTYEIVVLFTRTSNRDVAARIGGSPTPADVFTASNSLNAGALLFNASYTNGRGSNAGAAPLDTVTTTADGESVAVHVNGLAATDVLVAGRHDDERTQYDGVAYRRVTVVEPPGPGHRDVFLIAGQSNADGRGLTSGLTGPLAPYAVPQPEVMIHYTNPAFTPASDPLYRKWVTLRPGFSVAPGSTGPLPRGTFGMEIGAGKILAQHFAHPAFIKVTRGGTALGVPGTDWYPAALDSPQAGPLYVALIASTRLALQELTDAGNSYTLHALFWHQGESDGSREAAYGDLLEEFIRCVRRDLALPNLRFVIGELAPDKPQGFRDVQWQASREVRNASFVSARNLTTTDGTHFDTLSMVAYGERLGSVLAGHGRWIDFESPAFTPGDLDRQNDFSAPGGVVTVTTTESQGDYQGGQAAGNLTSSGDFSFHREGVLPLSGARSMQADFLAGQAGSSLSAGGWEVDRDGDGQFDGGETGIAMGLHASGVFHLQTAGAVQLAAGFPYQAGHWYRLTSTWSDPDGTGDRQVALRVRDLSAAQDLNGGQAVAVMTFGPQAVDPARWHGLGMRVHRGLIDHVGVEAPGFAGWVSNRFPALAGGPDGDDDGDNIGNAFEYALALDPTRPDPAGSLPSPVLGPESLVLSFPEIARAEDVRVAVDWSTDLTDWQPINGDGGDASLDFTVPRNGEPRIFLRQHLRIDR